MKANKAGSKLAKRAAQGTCTIKDINIMTRALLSMFYNKRFESGKYSIKVM